MTFVYELGLLAISEIIEIKISSWMRRDGCIIIEYKLLAAKTMWGAQKKTIRETNRKVCCLCIVASEMIVFRSVVAFHSPPQPEHPIQRLARDDDVDEVGGVAVKAVLAQGGAVGFALAMQEQMAARALQFLVEIADVAARIGGDDARGELTVVGAVSVEARHQIVAVDVEAAHRGVEFVDVDMVEHIALETQQARVARGIRREELDEIVVHRLALIVANPGDDLEIAVDFLNPRTAAAEQAA